MSPELSDCPRHAPFDLADMADDLIHSRRTVLPRRLLGPGPSPAQLRRVLNAASAAPDHGSLTPWRFVIVPEMARTRLAAVFAQSLLTRDVDASPAQLAGAREKAYRAPLLMLAIVHEGKGDPEIDSAERLASTGCAIQNMLLMATALGFGSSLTGGKALGSAELSHLFELEAGERALCFISIGSVQRKPRERERPSVERYVRELAVSP